MAGISPRTRCSQFKSPGAYNTSRASPELLLTLCFYLILFQRRTMTLWLGALSRGFGCGCKLCVTLGKSLNASPPRFKAGMRLPPSPLLAPSSEPGMGTGRSSAAGLLLWEQGDAPGKTNPGGCCRPCVGASSMPTAPKLPGGKARLRKPRGFISLSPRMPQR